jgi:hypothetical protein
MFFAWAKEPPADEMVTTRASGFTQKAFSKPNVIESVLKGLDNKIQFLIDVTFDSYAQDS